MCVCIDLWDKANRVMEDRAMSIEVRTVIRDNYLVIGALIVTFVFGGSVTIGGMTFRNPIGDYLKTFVIKERDVIDRVSQLKSLHAITTVFTVTETAGPATATLTAVSTRANEFFGKLADSKDLIDQPAGILMDLIKPYMDETDYNRLLQDQLRLLKEVEADRPAIAQVPVIFDDRHPHDSFRNRAFLPVIVNLETSESATRDRSEQTMLLAYLNLDHFRPAVDIYEERLSKRAE